MNNLPTYKECLNHLRVNYCTTVQIKENKMLKLAKKSLRQLKRRMNLNLKNNICNISSLAKQLRCQRKRQFNSVMKNF